MGCPVDYSLLDQTVTVYRLQGSRVRRTVYEGAYLEMTDSSTCDAGGREQERKFLLILPGQDDLLPGDRVYEGIGPEVTALQWSRFIPALTPGLGEIRYVRPYYWQGLLCHTEAGR